MDQQVRRINAEYGLNLTEEEIQKITREAEAQDRVLQALYHVDLGAVRPILGMMIRPLPSQKKRGRR